MRIFNRNIVDQWGLRHCALVSTRHTTKNTEICREHFTAVKNHLKHQISFRKWCNKIDPFMQVVNPFNIVNKNEHLAKYKILPLFWQAMYLDMKKTAMEILKNQGNVWNID